MPRLWRADSHQRLLAAAEAAAEARDDYRAGAAWIALLELLTLGKMELNRAGDLLAPARAAVARAGKDPELRSHRLLMASGRGGPFAEDRLVPGPGRPPAGTPRRWTRVAGR